MDSQGSFQRRVGHCVVSWACLIGFTIGSKGQRGSLRCARDVFGGCGLCASGLSGDMNMNGQAAADAGSGL